MRTLSILTISILFLQPFSSFGSKAQEKVGQPKICELGVDASPTLRGFHLGMTVEEVKSHLSLSMIEYEKADELGILETTIYGSNLNDSEQSKNLEKIKFEFLDGRIAYIEIIYDGSVKWDSINQFTSKITESLKLPDSWNEPLSSHTKDLTGKMIFVSGRKLECKGFNVGLIWSSTGLSELILAIANLKTIKEDRRKALQEKQRKIFKP